MSAGREPVISRPLKRMRPRVGARKWVRRLKQVVLPAPLGPMSAWIVPRCTRSLTSFTATKPRNSLVSPSVSRMTSSAISGGQAGGRIEARLPLLLPGAVGLVHLPRRHALALRPQHLLEQPARVAVERLVEQSLGVGGRGGRGAARLPDDGRERPVEVGARTHPVDEADGARRRSPPPRARSGPCPSRTPARPRERPPARRWRRSRRSRRGPRARRRAPWTAR